MALISFNFEKKQIYLIVGIFIFILEDFIVPKKYNKDYKNKCSINFLNFISKIFLIIPYLITIRYQSKNNYNLKNKNIVNLNKIYNFKILPKDKNFRNFILILLCFLIISELYSNFLLIMIPENSIKIHRYKLMFFIFLIYFYKIIFKKPLFNHHYLSIILLSIIIFFLTINNLFI